MPLAVAEFTQMRDEALNEIILKICAIIDPFLKQCAIEISQPPYPINIRDSEIVSFWDCSYQKDLIIAKLIATYQVLSWEVVIRGDYLYFTPPIQDHSGQ